MSCRLAACDDLMFWRTQVAKPFAKVFKNAPLEVSSFSVTPRFNLLILTSVLKAARSGLFKDMATYACSRLGSKVQSAKHTHKKNRNRFRILIFGTESPTVKASPDPHFLLSVTCCVPIEGQIDHLRARHKSVMGSQGLLELGEQGSQVLACQIGTWPSLGPSITCRKLGSGPTVLALAGVKTHSRMAIAHPAGVKTQCGNHQKNVNFVGKVSSGHSFFMMLCHIIRKGTKKNADVE